VNAQAWTLVWIAFAAGVIAGCIQAFRDRSSTTIFLTTVVVGVLVYVVGALLLS
jgi:hypothetical protein